MHIVVRGPRALPLPSIPIPDATQDTGHLPWPRMVIYAAAAVVFVVVFLVIPIILVIRVGSLSNAQSQISAICRPSGQGVERDVTKSYLQCRCQGQLVVGKHTVT